MSSSAGTAAQDRWGDDSSAFSSASPIPCPTAARRALRGRVATTRVGSSLSCCPPRALDLLCDASPKTGEEVKNAGLASGCFRAR